MTSLFKVGDRVRAITEGDCLGTYVEGDMGPVSAAGSGGIVYVCWDLRPYWVARSAPAAKTYGTLVVKLSRVPRSPVEAMFE